MAPREELIELDFTGYVDTRGVCVPEGEYVVRISLVQAKESQVTGNKYVLVGLEVMTGAHVGSTIIDRLMLMDSGMWRWDGLLKALNIKPPKGKLQLQTSQLVGKSLKIRTTVEEYNGGDVTRIQDYLPAATPASAPSAPAVAEVIEAEIESTIEEAEAAVEEINEAVAAPQQPAANVNPWTGAVASSSIEIESVAL